MKKIVLILGLLFSTQLAFTQAPEKINYQAVARDASGNPLVNQTLNVTYQIRQSSPTGTSVYTETHSGISTNQFGLFTAEIGGGTPSVGTFAGINWGTGLYYLYVEVNGDPMGSSQLLSVPYALYAKQSANGPQGLPGRNSISIVTPEPAGANCQNGGNKIDVGTDDNGDNILQALEIDFTYFVCNGDSGTAVGDNWGNQVVAIQGSNISGDGTNANPLTVINNDNDSTNELQDLSITGNTINISNGTGISLSPTTPTTNQVLTWNGTAWTAQNATSGADNWGSQVVVSDTTLTGDGTSGNPLGVNGVLTDNQDLSLTGNSLSLTNDPTPVDLSPFMDNTDAQTLTLASNTLTISNGNSVTLPAAPTYTAGTGINLAGNVITNTAPDQTVALNNGTGINVTGTYPNFTINNTSPASGINITGGGITNVTSTPPNFTISTPAQTLTYTAPNLTLSNGGGTVTIPPSPWGKTGTAIHPLVLTDNVGIGTTTPLDKLHVDNGSFRLSNGGAYLNIYRNTGEYLFEINSGSFSVAANGGGTGFTMNDGDATFNLNTHINGQFQLINGTQGNGRILVSDASGNSSWVDPNTMALGNAWLYNGTDIYNGNSGNVGIGTTAPNVNGATKALTIAASNSYVANKVASLELQGSHNGSNVDIGKIDFNSVGGSISNHARISSVNGGGTIGSSGRLLFHTANGGVLTEQVRITETGNVGIGTTSPSFPLHVYTTSNIRGAYIETNGANATTSKIGVTGIVTNGTGTGINKGGAFNAIGGSSLNYGVDAQAINGGSDQRGINTIASGGTGVNYGIYSTATGGSTNWSGYFAFGDFHINDNVGIGTTTISGTGYKFRVEASEMINGFYVQNTTSANIAYANRGRISHTGTSAGYAIHGHAFGTGTGNKYGVYGTAYSTGTETKYGIYGTTISGGTGTRYAGYFSGDVHISGTLTNPSDRKLKTNISQVNFNAINLLKSLNIYEYQYKTDENFKSMNLPSGIQVGFMADELKSLFPSLVKKEKIDLNAIPDSDSPSKIMEYEAVNYIGMTPILIKAIQEQQKMIEELQKEIKELKENK